MRWHISEIVFFVGFVFYVVIRGVHEEKTKKVEKAVRRVDAWERGLFVIVFAGCLLLPVVYLFTPFLSFADYALPTWAWNIGTAVMVLALWLFWRSHHDLALNWSKTLELRHGHEIVRTGVYRRVRHPMYAAITLFGLAQGLMLHNWLAGWAGLATFLIMYFIRVPREEKMLCEHFGDDYRKYMTETGRLLPKFNSPSSRSADPPPQT